MVVGDEVLVGELPAAGEVVVVPTSEVPVLVVGDVVLPQVEVPVAPVVVMPQG